MTHLAINAGLDALDTDASPAVGKEDAAVLRAMLPRLRSHFGAAIPTRQPGELGAEVIGILNAIRKAPKGMLNASIDGALLADKEMRARADEEED